MVLNATKALAGSIRATCVVVVLVAGMSIEAGNTDNVNLKWSQNEAFLFVRIPSDCLKGSISSSFARTRVEVTCTMSALNDELKLDFVPREDISPKGSQCHYVEDSKTISCKIAKVHAHYFDRLTTDPAEKRYATVDWDAMNDKYVERHAEADESAYDEDSIVQSVSVADVVALVGTVDAVVVDIAFPWCSYCGRHRDSFEKMAQKLKKLKESVKLVHMDAREERDIAFMWNISCSFNCGYIILKQNEGSIGHPLRIDAERPTDQLLGTIQAFLPELVTGTTIEAATKRLSGAGYIKLKNGKVRKAASSVAFGIFNDNSTELLSSMTRVAEHFRLGATKTRPSPTLKFFSVRGDFIMDRPSPVFVVRRPDGTSTWLDEEGLQTRTRTTNGLDRDSALHAWMMASAMPLISAHGTDLLEGLLVTKLPVLHIFIDELLPLPEQYPAFYRELALKYFERIMFCTVDNKALGYMGVYMGLGEVIENLPSIGIMGPQNETHPSQQRGYKFEGDPNLKEDVDHYIQSYLGGDVQVYYKNKPHPPDYTYSRGNIKILNSDDVRSGSLTSDADYIIGLIPAFGERQAKNSLLSLLSKLAKYTQEVEDLVVASFENGHNELPPGSFADNFEPGDALNPMLCMVTNRHCKVYNGKMSAKKVLPWLKKVSKKVFQDWKVIQEQIKQSNMEYRARKETDRAQLQSIMDQLDDLTPSIFSDGQVKIYTVVEAPSTAESLHVGSHVTVNVSERLISNGKVTAPMDSLDLVVGEQHYLTCVDSILEHMKVGEEAFLICEPNMAYGDIGHTSGVPPNAALLVDIKIIAIEVPPIMDENDDVHDEF